MVFDWTTTYSFKQKSGIGPLMNNDVGEKAGLGTEESRDAGFLQGS